MRQNIDQTSVNNIPATLLRDLSFVPFDINNLLGWRAQPAQIVCAVILELEIA